MGAFVAAATKSANTTLSFVSYSLFLKYNSKLGYSANTPENSKFTRPPYSSDVTVAFVPYNAISAMLAAFYDSLTVNTDVSIP